MVEDDVSTASGSSEDGVAVLPDSNSNSSFMGDETMKRIYEDAVAQYQPNNYWRVHDWNVQVIAARAIKRHPEEWPTTIQRQKTLNKRSMQRSSTDGQAKVRDLIHINQTNTTLTRSKDSKPFNPYEGDESALQLNESIPDFLSRLQPSKTSTGKPWIWIADFYSHHRPLNENTSVFRQQGSELLVSYLSKKRDLEAHNPQKPAGAITRMLTPDRKILESGLRTLAEKNGITCGKWMFFPPLDKVDEIWAAVVHGTVDGRLGCAAKVAASTDKPEGSRLVCVYTEDFSNVDDVKRVLKEIHRLNLIEIAGHSSGGEGRDSIYYKCDAYTHLDITSQNEYKLRASMYSSKDMLAELRLAGEL